VISKGQGAGTQGGEDKGKVMVMYRNTDALLPSMCTISCAWACPPVCLHE
jgi:hypothetical protein